MSSTISYLGYVASIDYSPRDELIVGRVINTRDSISFHAEAAADVLQEFHAIIDSYLVSCREMGTEPEKPYSGRFLVRIDPSLHSQVAAESARSNLSLNSFVERALRAQCRAQADGHSLGIGATEEPSHRR